MMYIYLLSILFSLNSNADLIVSTVKDNQAVLDIKDNEKVAEGNILSSQNGSFKFVVSKVRDNKAVVTIPSGSTLAVGEALKLNVDESLLSETSKEIEKKQPEVVPAKAEDPSIAKEAYGAFVLGIIPSPIIRINGTLSTSTQVDPGHVDYNLSSGIMIGYEWSQYRKHSWNNGYQIDYANMALSNITFVDSYGSSSSSVDGSIRVLNISYSGKYLWDTFYFPVGLGIVNSAILGNSSTFTNSINASVVAWLGMGIHPSNKFSAELISKSSSVTASTVTYSNGLTVTPSGPRPRSGRNFLEVIQIDFHTFIS